MRSGLEHVFVGRQGENLSRYFESTF